MDRQSQRPDITSPRPATEPFTASQIRTLKTAIVVMSVILVIGFCAILARLFYLATRPATPPASGAAVTLQQSAPLMADIALALPAGANVRSMSLTPASDHLAIHFEAPAGPGIVIVDLRSGKPVSRIRLTTSP